MRAQLLAGRSVLIGVTLALLLGGAGPTVTAGTVPEVFPSLEVVATNIGRPIQLAFDGQGRLLVLGHGWRGDSAGELVRLDVGGALPIDLSRRPRVVIPFADEPRKLAFGSVAVDPRSDDVYLGEENGNRVYRLSPDQRLTAVAIGLQHLVGGSSIALDAEGRLVVLDFVSTETQLRAETPPPLALESLAAESYYGPAIFRVDFGLTASLHRRLDLVRPLLPASWTKRAGVEPPTRLISVATLPGGDLVLLDSLGHVLRFGGRGEPRLMATLPAGHFHRTSLAVGPDGSVFVSTGFHVRQVYRVSPASVVTVVAAELGDPEGIAVDGQGRVYVAETALHRVIRIAVGLGGR